MKDHSIIIDVNAHIHQISYEIGVNSGFLDLHISFRNTGDGVITAVKLLATGYNSFGDVVLLDGNEKFCLMFQDLRIERFADSGKLLFRLRNTDIRRLVLEEYQICYEDSKIVTYAGRQELVIRTKAFEDNEQDQITLAALREYYPTPVRFLPRDYDCGWFCACGCFNRPQTNRCLMCGADKGSILRIADENAVSQIRECYTQIQSEKAQEEAEIKAGKDAEKPRVRRLVILSLLFILAIGVIFLFGITRTEVTETEHAKTETVYRFIDNRMQTKTIYYGDNNSSVSRFNALGQITNFYYTDLYNSYSYHIDYRYASGVLTKVINHYPEGDFVSDYRYSNFGKDLRITYFNTDGEFDGYSQCKCNGKGIITEEKVYDTDENLVHSYVYEYYDNGQIKHSTVYNADDIMEEEKEYDDSGKLLRETEYDSDGKPKLIIRYEYDETGYGTGVIEYDADNDDTTEYVVLP